MHGNRGERCVARNITALHYQIGLERSRGGDVRSAPKLVAIPPATSWPAWLAEIALLRRQVRGATWARATSLTGCRSARSERQMS